MFIIFQRCYRVQYRLQNIIFWAGQAAPEVDLPRCAFTCPSILLNKGEIGPLPRALPAGQGKSGSCSACPVAAFWLIHSQLATGPVVMLHAVLFKALG